MADALKATLFLNGSVTHNIVDISGSGAGQAAMTAAESHDANDATRSELDAPGDGGGLNGNATLDVFAALTTAAVSGTISFVRMKFRGKRVTLTETAGSFTPLINGVLRGSLQGLSTAFADYSQDFTTDPADSNAWTNAKLNAQTFGAQLAASTSDAAQMKAGHVDFPEFSVEVWGPSAVVDTPASLSIPLTVNAATGIPGLVVSTPASLELAITVNAPTIALGAVVDAPESLSMPLTVSDTGSLAAVGYDPTTQTPLLVLADGGNTPAVLRSNTSPYSDTSLQTNTLASSPGTWPNSGTLTWNFGGISAAAVEGTGLISGVKLFAQVRPTRDVHAVLDNFRFNVGADAPAIPAQPTVGTPLGPLTLAQWQTVQTDLVEALAGAPITWALLVGLFASWSLKADYSVGGGFAGEFAQAQVASAWIEVWGPVGVPPEFIELTEGLGDTNVVQGLTTLILPPQ